MFLTIMWQFSLDFLFTGLEHSPVLGSYEHDKELSDYMNDG